MESYTFTSSDQSKINAYRWTPSKPPIALIHISHGMGEHAARYDWTAQKLAEAGFLVTANDHRGHGKTADVLGDSGNGVAIVVRSFARDSVREHCLCL